MYGSLFKFVNIFLPGLVPNLGRISFFFYRLCNYPTLSCALLTVFILYKNVDGFNHALPVYI